MNDAFKNYLEEMRSRISREDRCDFIFIIIASAVIIAGMLFLIYVANETYGEDEAACRRRGGRLVDDPPVPVGVICTSSSDCSTTVYATAWHCEFAEEFK